VTQQELSNLFPFSWWSIEIGIRNTAPIILLDCLVIDRKEHRTERSVVHQDQREFTKKEGTSIQYRYGRLFCIVIKYSESATILIRHQ